MPTYIFHLASYGSLPSENIITQMVDVNIKGTINLVNASKNIDSNFLLMREVLPNTESKVKNERI